MTAIDCLYLLHTLIKAESLVHTLSITQEPCWHAAHSFLNVYSSVCLLKIVPVASAS